MEIINQNFEELKNGLVGERERERERGYSYLSETNQASDLSGFQFDIQRGKSDAILAADFFVLKGRIINNK